jgi:hypothetical protein
VGLFQNNQMEILKKRSYDAEKVTQHLNPSQRTLSHTYPCRYSPIGMKNNAVVDRNLARQAAEVR